MNLRIAALAAVLLAGSAVAGDEADRAKLMGSWKLADSGKDGPTWVLQDKGGVIHVVNSRGATVLEEFDCDTFGHESVVKVNGRPTTVSLWFVGAKLVEMETRGTSVLKRTFGLGKESDTMDLELTQIAPSSKTEIQHFERMPAASPGR
jgi:hypothetical protein